VSLRWEWRTFGDDLGEAGARLAALRVERVTESDETYLLAAAGGDVVKERAGLLDVKRLEEVDAFGLELWKPVMKAPLPVSADDARAVLRGLGVDAAALDGDAFSLADIAALSPGLAAAPVHKLRRHVTFEGCRAELTDLRSGERSVRSIAIESEEPARVAAAVRALGLEGLPNESVPVGLRALLANGNGGH
jgi:exopolyphosphatase/guanosine-5'-triphosphate,3'-diphosphate pyrophosphatase